MLPQKSAHCHDRQTSLERTNGKNAFQTNGTRKQAAVTVLRPYKIKLRSKLVRRYKDHVILFKENNPSRG